MNKDGTCEYLTVRMQILKKCKTNKEKIAFIDNIYIEGFEDGYNEWVRENKKIKAKIKTVKP